jgi:AraC-like DNA-binding protein
LRQGLRFEPALVRTFGISFDAGTFEPPLAAGWDRLVVASGARASLRAAGAFFPLVPGNGVWLPSGERCTVELAARGEIRVAYLRAVPGSKRPSRVCAVTIPPLVRELVSRAIARGAFDGRIPSERRLALVLFDEIEALRAAPLALPLPRPGPALGVAERLLADPSLCIQTAELARDAGCSARTLERAFALDVGVGVAAWRRRLRMLHAMRLLAQGEPVTSTALDSGYSGIRAFIAAFRREFGASPRRFVSEKK